ncbi:MAG: hypothetical protein LBK82_10765 [Planctomycetaceae bacterium]|nr:hypothetical protein [Planctomycetaceae bacterium]
MPIRFALPLQGDGLCVIFPTALRWVVTHCPLRGEEKNRNPTVLMYI